MTDLPKTFDPATIEARWYAHWEERGLFRPDRPGAEPWTIVNPPPNVTGSLHIGHALDNTLQDILTRHARLKGKDAMWVVGTDHAGIATQMVVERQLAADGLSRADFTRDEFIARVWEWKDESGGEITRQLRRLGCSMDWSREQFTMDPHFSRAVNKVFVDLYREGLLYRDKRLVNWDPGLGTAISDLEVETREVNGKFWTLRYPLADGSGAIEVATTRPETMLADMAVAVHPDDERYRELVGRQVRLPITGRLVPIIADTHADPALGSGAVKITPGHDFNDFEVGRRTGIEARAMLNMLDAGAKVVQCGGVPDELIGLDRFAARARVVEMLEADGALVRVEDRVIATPFGDRSGVVIEPWLTDQWYVDAKTLAAPAIDAVRSGAIRIVPASWEKTFFNWMENIQPWCVSRQIIWGHQVPAWYGFKSQTDSSLSIDIPDDDNQRDRGTQEDEVVIAPSEAEALIAAKEVYGGRDVVIVGGRAEAVALFFDDPKSFETKSPIWRDPDVLDTWFSSALWPFATLGWPDDQSSPSSLGEGDHAEHGGGAGANSAGFTDAAPPPLAAPAVPLPETSSGRTLKGRYPNDVLVSGFDILFFWDARMMMQGLHFMHDVPFRTLYLHGLVRAGDGSKMSKSKGNTVDPLILIDRYGADALRFFMAAMESQGRDIKMDERRVEGYRNFATKLWNAARFAQANGIGGAATLEPPPATLAVNQWIIGETIRTVQAVDLALVDYRFDAAANAIYHFVWDRFCDWYLELIKPLLSPSRSREGLGEGPPETQYDDATTLPPPTQFQVNDAPHRSGQAGSLTDLKLASGRGAEEGETRAVAGWVFDQILVVLHPFMPFITEELWHALAPREHELIVAHWPQADARALYPAADAEIEWLIRLVSEVRAARTELNVPPGAMLEAVYLPNDAEAGQRFTRNETAANRAARLLAGVGPVLNDDEIRVWVVRELGASIQIVTEGGTLAIKLSGAIDISAERTRLAKAVTAAEKERDALAVRLGNASFVERAKPEAVDKARADHADKAAEAERLTAALARLG